MKTLVKYEFLKILRKPSTLIVMVVSVLLTAFLFGLPILQYQIYNQEGVLRGLAGIEYEKALASENTVVLNDEFVQDIVHEVTLLFADPDNVGFDGTEKFLIGNA